MRTHAHTREGAWILSGCCSVSLWCYLIPAFSCLFMLSCACCVCLVRPCVSCLCPETPPPPALCHFLVFTLTFYHTCSVNHPVCLPDWFVLCLVNSPCLVHLCPTICFPFFAI